MSRMVLSDDACFDWLFALFLLICESSLLNISVALSLSPLQPT